MPAFDSDIPQLRLTAARLRGRLPAEEPGARGLEHMARNPACLRLAAITLAGSAPGTVSEIVHRRPVREGLSPFAIQRGNRFEAAVLANSAERLAGAYRAAGWLPEGQDPGCADMSERHPGTGPEDLQARRAASEQLVLARAGGDLSTPALIVKPRLAVRCLGHEWATEPDALFAGPGEPAYRAVEIKSYADRHGETDAAKTGSACRQAAVAVIAMRQLLEHNGLAAPGLMAPAACDLVFAKPGTNMPTLHRMSAAGEIESLAAALHSAHATLEEAAGLLDGRPLDSPQALELLPNAPCAACSDHCQLWEICRGQALQDGLPAALGDAAAELLGPAVTLQRACDLRDGAAPASADERLIGELLAEARAAFQSAAEAG